MTHWYCAECGYVPRNGLSVSMALCSELAASDAHVEHTGHKMLRMVPHE